MASLHADHEHVHFACAYAAQTDLRRSSAVSSSATFLKACLSSSRTQWRKACRVCDEHLLVGFHVWSIQSKWGGAANFGRHAAALSLVMFMEPCKLAADMRTINLILTCRQPSQRLGRLHLSIIRSPSMVKEHTGRSIPATVTTVSSGICQSQTFPTSSHTVC